jgi:CheY-like chemotaxis protein
LPDLAVDTLLRASMHFPHDPSSGRSAIDPEALRRRPAQDALPGACAYLFRYGWARRAPRILVVEDNRDSAEVLSLVLSAMGFQVLVAHDGPGGLRAALDARPTLVLSDIDLPGCDGFELAERLRGERGLEQVPLVALTGRLDERDWVRALDAGFTRYLTKPVDPDRLGATICELLDRRRPAAGGDYRGPERRLH